MIRQTECTSIQRERGREEEEELVKHSRETSNGLIILNRGDKRFLLDPRTFHSMVYISFCIFAVCKYFHTRIDVWLEYFRFLRCSINSQFVNTFALLVISFIIIFILYILTILYTLYIICINNINIIIYIDSMNIT